ncbi:hypothetical protein HZ326_25023 [Fusarium oxysporum f. sp. albedinis]|nr:hypothetical protein HZ326_25023 [Fusarium oxysporum f. sp. albedinis]
MSAEPTHSIRQFSLGSVVYPTSRYVVNSSHLSQQRVPAAGSSVEAIVLGHITRPGRPFGDLRNLIILDNQLESAVKNRKRITKQSPTRVSTPFDTSSAVVTTHPLPPSRKCA